MPRVNIYFTEDTLNELRKFIKEKHGNHRALSLTVQQAVKEFLSREKCTREVSKWQGQGSGNQRS